MYVKSNKRKLQAEQTKRLIYKTAAKLFSCKNYNDVTIEEIADASGVSVGTFYHYFKNKQEIFAIFYKTLDDEYQNFYIKMADEAEHIKLSPIQKLEVFLLHTTELIAKQGIEFLRVIYPYMLQDKEFGDSMVLPERNFFRIVRELIDNGKTCGEISSDIMTDQIISDITIICRGCEVDWCINRGRDSIRDHSVSAIKNYLRGISSR